MKSDGHIVDRGIQMLLGRVEFIVRNGEVFAQSWQLSMRLGQARTRIVQRRRSGFSGLKIGHSAFCRV